MLRSTALEQTLYDYTNKFWYVRYVAWKDPDVLDLDVLHKVMLSWAYKVKPKFAAASIHQGGRIDVMIVFHHPVALHATELPKIYYESEIYYPNEVYHVKKFNVVHRWFDQFSVYYTHTKPWSLNDEVDITDSDIEEIIQKYFNE